MRRIAAMLLLFAAASAMPIAIGFSYANSSYFLQGKEYSVTVTITNEASVNDSIDVYLDTDGKALLVNNSSRYKYSIASLSSNASSAKSIGITVTNSAKFGSSHELCAEAYDSNGTSSESCLVMAVPGFSGISASLGYTPSKNATATLTVSGKTSSGASTTRFNTSYFVYNDSTTCANGSGNGTSFKVSLSNCTTGLYDVAVSSTADGYTRSKIIRGFFLYRTLSLSATFYRVELFGYERPISEIGSARGSDEIHVWGYANYDDGTALSWPPDSFSSQPLSLTIGNSTYYTRPHEDGKFYFAFNAPKETGNYTVKVIAHGAHSLNAELDYTLTVNNIKSYMPKKENITEVLGNIGLSILGNGTMFNVTVSNRNLISITGKPTIIGTSQFIASEPPSDSVLGMRNRTYPLAVRPRRYTRPGNYSVDVGFATIYGTVRKKIWLSVPSPPIDSSKVSVLRYLEYSNRSKVFLKAINPLPTEATVAIIEKISKAAIPSLVSISELVASCNSTNYSCKLGYVLSRGSCSDCYLVGGNLSSNCTTSCTNRTAPVFSPPYTKLISADPTVEWDLKVPAGGAREVSYTINKLANASWFSEPNYSYSIAEAVPTPMPPPPTPTPTAVPTASPKEKASNSLPLSPLIAVGVVFLIIIMGIVLGACLLLKKKDEVSEFLEKYLPKEPEVPEEERERERLRKLFVEGPKKVSDALTPAKKEEGPTRFSPKIKEAPLKKDEPTKPVGRQTGNNLNPHTNN